MDETFIMISEYFTDIYLQVLSQNIYFQPKLVAIHAKNMTKESFRHSEWRNMSITPASFVCFSVDCALFWLWDPSSDWLFKWVSFPGTINKWREISIYHWEYRIIVQNMQLSHFKCTIYQRSKLFQSKPC